MSASEYSFSRPPPRESDQAPTPPPSPQLLKSWGGCVLDGGGFKRRGSETRLRDEKRGPRGEVSHFAWRQAGRGALHRCYSLISGGGGGNNPQRPSKKRTFLFFFPRHTTTRREEEKKPSEGAHASVHTQKVRRRGNGPHFCTCTHPDMRVVYVYTLCISVCYNIPLL